MAMTSLQEQFASKIEKEIVEVEYVASDKDGRVYAYPTRPYVVDDTWDQVGYRYLGDLGVDVNNDWRDVERIVDKNIELVPGKATTITYNRKSNGGLATLNVEHDEIPEWANYMIMDSGGCVYVFENMPRLYPANDGSSNDTFLWSHDRDGQIAHVSKLCPMVSTEDWESLIWKLVRPGEEPVDPDDYVFYDNIPALSRRVSRITGVRIGFARRAAKHVAKVVEFKEGRGQGYFGTHWDTLKVAEFCLGLISQGLLKRDSSLADIDRVFDNLDRTIEGDNDIRAVTWTREFFGLS